MDYEEMIVKGDVDKVLEEVRAVCGIKLRKTILNKDDHEDIAQEIITKIYRYLDKFDPSRGKFSTFANQIMNSTIKDCYRVHNKNPILNPASFEFTGIFGDVIDHKYASQDVGDKVYTPNILDQKYCFSELFADIENSSKITPRELSILKLKVKGYKNREVAKMLKCTDARICQLWSGIQEKVKKLI